MADHRSPAEAAACRDAARRAWRYLMTPAMFLDSVERIESDDVVGAQGTASFRITYETAFGVGTVQVTGSAIDRADWEPLLLRRRLILATSVCGIFSAGAAASDYGARHPWFAIYGARPGIFALALLAGAFAAVAVLGWSLSARGRKPLRTWLPTAASALLVLSAVGTARAVVPQGPRAAELLGRDDTARAQLEAEAVLMEEPADPDARRVVDALRLRAVAAAGSVADAYELAQEPWFLDSVKTDAIAELGRRVTTELARATAAGDLDGVRRLSGPASVLDGSTQLAIRRSLALLDVRRCLAAGTLACIPDTIGHALSAGVPGEQLAPLVVEARSALGAEHSAAMEGARLAHEPENRAARLADAIAVTEIYSNLVGREFEPGLERLRELHRAATEAAEREARVRADQQRRARERAEREAVREAEQRERQERARSRAYASLRCCDGTLSPSCICEGSHRGCCSHHGGVCGCSQ